MLKLTSAALVAAISGFFAGSTDDFAVVYEQFANEIRIVASCELRSFDIVEDVVQETFLRARERPGSFPSNWDGDVDDFRKWLRSIARNRCRETFGATEKRRSVRALPPDDGSAVFELDGSETWSRCDAEDFVTVVIRDLARIDPVGEKVIRMRRLEDCSLAEIAEFLDVEEKTVSNKLSIALGILRELPETRHAS